MRKTILKALTLLASFAGASNGAVTLAQSGATASDPVVVTARPLPDRRQTLRWFGSISGYPSGDEPLARMTEPLCIAISGMSAKAAVPIANRILEHAERLGIRLGGEKCSPNVLVLFVENGARQVAWLADHRPSVFGTLSTHEVSALTRDKGPVHAWSLTAITSRDGDPLIQIGGGVPTLRIPTASRISLSTKAHIAAALVLIDNGAAEGKTVNQIADYTTMRLLAQIRPRKGEGVSTILSLFDADGAAPEAMTPFDWGYLRGLYSGPGDRRPMFQYAAMARFVEEETAKGEPKP
ncbi:hypothetical protein [Sphingomonas sp. GM_Shp_1]|uniref:hypothetical protein n=1 Tax=Sphingomonas sp. GM_Shp_1 TaxID=2937381 RepID=UPI00226B7317|nr:hypothetical protein [Sphingomonas sp. GM_Shp_1]